MNQDLPGYLVGALEPHEQREVEAYLHAHPEAQTRLESLRNTLEPLEWDPAEVPPAGLAARTLAQLAPVEIAAAPSAAEWARRDFRPSRRLVEMVVAAVVLLVVTGVIAAWLGQTRHQRPGSALNALQVIECKYNLQKIFCSGLQPYSDHHGGQFPAVAHTLEQPSRNLAGLVYPILYGAKLLSPDVSIRCPGAMGCGAAPYGLEEIKDMDREAFECWANHLHHSYAYTLGYLVNAEVVGLRLEREKPSSQMPLMADSAPPDPKIGNSPHHGGHGQNVLYCDGHVAFCYNRHVGYQQDDIYLNRAGKVAAGLDWSDTVLSSSLATP